MNRMNSTRFMEVEELREQLERVDLKEECFPAGGVPLSTTKESAWLDTTDSHTIVFGATGSKKTRMIVMPTVEILSRAGESFVVTDPKGEIYNRTSGGLEAKGYRIFTLNLRDYEAGEPWNPLQLPYQYYKEGNVAKAVEMVSSIAGMLVDSDTADPYWSNTARDVAIGLMLMLFEEAASEEKCNIKSLLACWQGYLRDKKKFREKLRQNYVGTIVGDKLQCLDNSSEKTVGSIEAVFATGINKFSTNERLIDYLSQRTTSFSAMLSKKSAIYLIMPDENKFYHFIVSLFLEQLYEVLIKNAQQSPDGKLSNRMNYLIDEFANLPKIENFDSMITASRSRNIRYVLIVQSVNQLTEKYEEAQQVICSNCNNWIYLYSKEYDLLTQISRLCGTVIYDNNLSIPLISEFDLQHLSKEKGEALVLCGRNYPCLVNLLDIDEYPFERGGKKEVQYKLQPVEVVGQKKKGGSAYSHELPESVIDYCYQGRQIEHDAKCMWLVATFDGMIIRGYLTDRISIEEGTTIMEKSIQDFSFAEAMQIKWYRADRYFYERYKGELREHPELVYLTVEELQAATAGDALDGPYEGLIPESNVFAEWAESVKRAAQFKREVWYCDAPEDSDYCCYLEIMEDGVARTEMWKKLCPWPGMLGMIHRHNVSFRAANGKLLGTKYEKLLWESYEISGLGGRYESIAYRKYIDDENYAIVAIAYFYYD